MMTERGVCTKEKEIQEIRDMAVESRNNFCWIQKDIKDMRENHLSHMQASLENMDAKLNAINLLLAKWIGAGIVLLAVIDYLIKRY